MNAVKDARFGHGSMGADTYTDTYTERGRFHVQHARPLDLLRDSSHI